MQPEKYVLVSKRTPTPFYDKLARGEISKLEHLSQEDIDTIMQLARVIFEEGVAVGKASVNKLDFTSPFNY